MVRKRKLNFWAIAFLVFAVVFTSCICIFGGNKLNTEAMTGSNVANRVQVSQIFNNTKQIFDRKYLDELAQKASYTDFSDLITKVGTNGDVKTANQFSSVLVKFGEYTFGGTKRDLVWIPSYLKKENGKVVLTLWLASTGTANGTLSNQETSTWSDGTYKYNFSASDTQTYNGVRVYAHTYDGSFIRNVTLLGHGSGTYTNSWGYRWNGSTAVPVTGSPAPILANRTKFTQLTSGNLAQYIVAPANISWQVSETERNDIGYSSNTYYPANWKNDKIWLPSQNEIKDGGLWNISGSQCVGDVELATRTATSSNSAQVRGVSTSGYLTGAAVSNTFAVRPALHLDLSAVDSNSAYLYDNPLDVNTVFNNSAQEVKTLATVPSWYSSDFEDTNKFKMTFYDSSNTLTTTMKDKGLYWIKIEADANYNAKFLGTADTSDSLHVESDSVRWIRFNIDPKVVNFPRFYNNQNKLTYKGGTNINFELESLGNNASVIEIEVPKKFDGIVTYDKVNFTATVTEVGKYELDVSLTSDNYKWATTNNKLEFEVERATVKLELDDGNGNKALRGVGESTMDAFISVDANFAVHTSRTVTVNIVAKATGLTSRTLGSLDLTNASRINEKVTLNLAGLRYDTQYTLDVEIDESKHDGGSYTIDKTDVTTLDVQDPDSMSKITWQMYADNNLLSGKYIDVEVDDSGSVSTVTTAFDKGNIVYDGKHYTFTVRVPDDYQLDLTYGIGGYDVTCADSSNTQIGKNAGIYSTKIRVENKSTHAKQIYELTWQIEVAKFDLSNLKWLNNGKVEYNEGADVSPVLDPATLPAGLIPNYSGVKIGNNVGDGGRAIVTFALESGYIGNYELPANGGKGTNYIFNGSGDFEWEKEWDVIPAIIKLEWEEKAETDVNGNPFNVLVLKDPRIDGKVDYLFYETDNRGNIKDINNPLALEDIEVSLTVRKYYKVMPSIKSGYANNYEFPNNNTADYSIVFSIGGGASGVTVTLDKDSIEYTGKPVNLKVNITGASTLNQLTLTYYLGDVVNEANKLASAPTNAGKYTVVITSNTPTVLLSGTTQFEFEITKSVISTAWNNNAKPPVLNLKYGQLNGIQYEIVDINNVPITNIRDIVAGEYAIRAKITDTANYIFDDNTIDTAWVTFTVREGDAIYDPSDPSNPFNPTDPDNPIGPGNGDDNDGSVLDKIKEFFENLIESNFPLWQVCTMAVGGLLSLIFLIKSIQYGNRRKKAKGEAKKISAKTYAAIAPIFATDIIYAGLTNQIWSIIAFSVVGLTLIMFVAMLITRSAWKKAELAKESAVEEREQLKESKQLALQERITQISQDGVSADTSALEQRLFEMETQRREDEERHRQEMEAMKLMFANLMGRAQGANPDDTQYYGAVEDTDLLAEKVFAKLLPAVQQMIPENTAYLTAPAYEESEELKNIVEEQNEQMRDMADQIATLQAQLSDMNANRVDGVIMPDQSAEIDALNNEIARMREQMSNMAQGRVEAELLPDQSAEIQALNEKIAQMQQQMDGMSYVSVDELDDTDFDDEEEWDSILDEDDDDFVEAVIIEEGGTVRKTTPNFRMRLKQSSEKNREWYAVIKNMFCSQKGVTYRVCKRVEKIRYQGQVVGVIGIAKRSIKLWLALKPYEYDARRYHHKDVSDKPRFVDVPMYIRVGSDRALTRAQELILALFQELNMEARKRYNDRGIQELIFTLKHNKLLTNKQNKQLLCEVMHVHDCDVLSDELAEKCIEFKNVAELDDSVIETVKLDDIDAKFQDGNRVTLDKLKKIGLVSEDCTGFTVTADKRLTKPLIIVANDFTLTAVKLITLTGGRAIKLQQV